MEGQSFAKFWVIITSAFLLVELILAAWFLSFQAPQEGLLESSNHHQLLLVEGTALDIEISGVGNKIYFGTLALFRVFPVSEM